MKGFTGLTDKQRDTIRAAQQEMNRISLIPCTTCDYCAKVCPMDIGISDFFTAMNDLALYSDLGAAKHQEGWLVDGHGRRKALECMPEYRKPWDKQDNRCPQPHEMKHH